MHYYFNNSEKRTRLERLFPLASLIILCNSSVIFANSFIFGLKFMFYERAGNLACSVISAIFLTFWIFNYCLVGVSLQKKFARDSDKIKREPINKSFSQSEKGKEHPLLANL